MPFVDAAQIFAIIRVASNMVADYLQEQKKIELARLSTRIHL